MRRRTTINKKALQKREQLREKEGKAMQKELGIDVFNITAASVDNPLDKDALKGSGSGTERSAASEQRTYTYFEPPERRSRSGILQASLRPSDLVERSAASVFLANPRKAVEQDTWVLCPNPCLANAIFEGQMTHIHSYGMDDGGTLEEPVAGNLKPVTLFGEFFAPETDFSLQHAGLGHKNVGRQIVG